MRYKIIGITGLKGSGKDTAANFLVEKYDCEIVKFAGPLKDMLRIYLLKYMNEYPYVVEELIEGTRKEEPYKGFGGKSTRYVMQTLGTEWGRDLISQSLWTDAALTRIKDVRKHKPVIVSDVRFVNEFTALKKLGATLIRVERDSMKLNTLHPSETGISALPVDIIIKNNGSLEDLRKEVEKVMGNPYDYDYS
jgi:hypothetical protein